MLLWFALPLRVPSLRRVTSTDEPSPRAHARGIALMIGSTACFTANTLLIRELGGFMAVNVWMLATVRFAVGLALVAAWYGRRFQPSHLLHNPLLLGRGIVGGAGVYFGYVAVVHLGAGLATFVNSTYIVWAALAAAWLYHERLRPVTAAGSAAALVGIGLLTGVLSLGVKVDPYDGFAILSALGSAYVAIAIRRLHATEHTATIFGAQCCFGLLITGPPAAIQAHPMPAAAAGLLLVAGLCAGIGQIMQTSGYRDLSVAEGSLLQMLGPLGTAVGAVACFGERLSPAQWTGAAIVLAGTAAAAVRRRPS